MQRNALALGGSILQTAQAAFGLATRGLPALRAALHGARLGAGSAMSPQVVERLGVEVVREAPAITQAGARAMMLTGKDGVALKLGSAGGVRAIASEGAVRAVARGTAGAAFRGVLRATRQGAVAGAVVDGLFGVLEAAKGLREGRLSSTEAAKLAGKRAARGAVAGGAGVAAAGVASAAVAAAGIAFAGAPIVVPIVTMAAAGIAVSRGFDKLFGE